MKKTIILFAIILFMICNIKSISKNYFTDNNLQLELIEGHLIIYKSSVKIMDISSINFNFTPPRSISVISSNDKEVKLKLIYPGVAEYREKGKDLIDTVVISKLENGLRFYCDPKWSSNVTIQLKDLNEHYFGVLEPLFPNNENSPDLRSKVVDVDVLEMEANIMKIMLQPGQHFT